MHSGRLARMVVAVAMAWTAGSAGNVALLAAGSSLVDAATRGDATVVSTLLRQRADANAADATGTTALHWAVRGGHADVVRRLLAAGAKAGAANRFGVTPLHLAATNGDVPTAKLLLASGANPSAALPEGETVLMTAARTGAADFVGLLLEAGADAHARESFYGETALHWAAADNHAETVRVLVAGGARVDERSGRQDYKRRRSGQSVLPLGEWTPLMYAARQDAPDAVRALVSAGARLDEADPDGATALVIAIINGHYDVAGLLVNAGANPNIVDKDAGMGPLYAAIDMHRLAVGHGRPNPRPMGTLTAVDVVRLMLEHKADPNVALKTAIFQRQHTIGDGSLGKGATPLMRAAKSGDVEMMRLLLAAGANPRATMPNQATAMMFAAGLGWRDGSPVAPSFDQGTEADATEAIDLLLAQGLSLDAATEQGDTALHVAVTNRGSATIVRHLIAKGANLAAVNKRGLTALAAGKASRRDRSELVAILSKAAPAVP